MSGTLCSGMDGTTSIGMSGTHCSGMTGTITPVWVAQVGAVYPKKTETIIKKYKILKIKNYF